jgi:hypothetical protein
MKIRIKIRPILGRTYYWGLWDPFGIIIITKVSEHTVEYEAYNFILEELEKSIPLDWEQFNEYVNRKFWWEEKND